MKHFTWTNLSETEMHCTNTLGLIFLSHSAQIQICVHDIKVIIIETPLIFGKIRYHCVHHSLLVSLAPVLLQCLCMSAFLISLISLLLSWRSAGVWGLQPDTHPSFKPQTVLHVLNYTPHVISSWAASQVFVFTILHIYLHDYCRHACAVAVTFDMFNIFVSETTYKMCFNS